MTVTLGCDPELLAIRDGEVVPAVDMIPGTKEDPYRVTHGAVQIDGTALEFNIDPVTNGSDWARNINSVLEDLKGMLPEGISMAFLSSYRYPKRIWSELPPSAIRSGCSPDFDAYMLIERSPPRLVDCLVSCGGHVHVGLPDAFNEWKHKVISVRALEEHLGTFLSDLEHDTERTKLYGQPGSFRPKDYGFEWRSPSNQWVQCQATIDGMYDRVMRTVDGLIETEFADYG